MQQPLALEHTAAVPEREGHCIALGKGLRLEFENAREGVKGVKGVRAVFSGLCYFYR